MNKKKTKNSGRGSIIGGNFERDTFKKLSLWFSKGKSNAIFWRTAGSGGRATTRAKSGLATPDSAGDMCALDPSGKPLTRISIWELKKGYSGKSPSTCVGVLNLIDGKKTKNPPLLIKWIEKVEGEAKTHKRNLWFLIFERKRKKACICMRKETMEYLKNKNNNQDFKSSCDLFFEKHSISITQLDHFLDWCAPETIKRFIKRRNKIKTP